VHEVEWARIAHSPGRSAGTRSRDRARPLWRSSAGRGTSARDTGQLRGRNDLGQAGEARGARSREVGQDVQRAVAGRGDAEDGRLSGRVRCAIGQVAGRCAGLDDAPRGGLAEGAGMCLARAEEPGRAGHAHAAGGEGVQAHGQRADEEPHTLLGRAVLARVAGGGVTGGGGSGASPADVRSRGAARARAIRVAGTGGGAPAVAATEITRWGGAIHVGEARGRAVGAEASTRWRRASAAAGRRPAVAPWAGRGLVAGQVDAGDERYVHGGGSGRGITRPARVELHDVDDAVGVRRDRRALDRQGRPEETVLDGLARAGSAAAIRVRRAARLRGIRVDAVARRRARPLGAIARAGPIAGDERAAGAYVEVGGGSGRGGAGRDRVGTAAADVQTGEAKVAVGDLRRAGGVGVELTRERRGRAGREARPAAARRADGRRVLERQWDRRAGRARRRGRGGGARRGGARAQRRAIAGAARTTGTGTRGARGDDSFGAGGQRPAAEPR